jgi:c(7)-type cytochrome triheme protein
MVSCGDCHARTYRSGYKTAPITMAQMEKGQSCGACHNGGVAFAVTEDCSACHPTKEITFETATAGSILFSHEVHTGMFGCSDCHSDLFLPNNKNQTRTMDQMEQGESCGACHDGDDAFSVAEDCSSCHSTRDIMFKTETAGNILFSHDIHTSMVSCSDCHDDVFKRQTGNPAVSMAQMESGESCGVCHDGSDAFSVAEDCSSCHPTKDITFKTAAVGNIAFSHDIHTSMFGCSDCHNDLFKQQTGNPPVSMSRMESGDSCGACHDGDDAFSVAEDCASCHPTRDITFKEEEMGNVLFSHEVHTDMFGCSECHPDLFKPQTGNKPVSMESMENGASCGACHDGDDAFSVAEDAEDCESCHIEN